MSQTSAQLISGKSDQAVTASIVTASTVALVGSTSGTTTLAAPSTAGNNTLTLPTGNGSNGQFLQGNGSGTLSWSGSLTLGTAQNSTSGTSIDFTGIPSWAKRVTVMFNGVSTNGTSVVQVQVGISSGIQVTGYNCSYAAITSTNACAPNTLSSGAIVAGALASVSRTGSTVFNSFGSNIWSFTGITADVNGSGVVYSSGLINLSGTLDRIRITTVNGTDTFDAGSINIMYEG